MALETRECNGVREGPKAELEGKGVVDLVDEKRSEECNDIGCGETEVVNGDAKDDVDGSYVFVSGETETDEITERDLDVDDNVDLGGSEGAEPSIETDDLSERDLGENMKVQTRISEVEDGVVENGGLTATAHAEVEEGPCEDKETDDQNEEEEDSVSSIEEVNCVEREKGELILEKGHNSEEICGPNLDSDLGTPNNREETHVTDVIVEYHVPEPVGEVANEVSCEEEGCGESFVEVVCKHDAVNGEIVTNGEVEGKVDGDSLDTSSSEIKVEDSEAVDTGTAESASQYLLNGMEMVSSDAEEKIPALEQSEIVVAVTDGSESLPLENVGILASTDAENKPAEEQADTEDTERSESESLPPVDEEKVVTLNPEQDIPAVEESAQCRIDSESENQSRVNLGDKSPENSQVNPPHTVTDVWSEADKGNTAEESNEGMPSSPVESPDAGGDAMEDLVESPEKLSACPVDEKGLEVESFDENVKFELKVGKESAESTQDVSGCSANDMDSGTTIEEVSTGDKNYPPSTRSCVESESEVISSLVKSQECASACPVVETRLEEGGENAPAIPVSDTTPATEDSRVIVEISQDALRHNVGDVKLESEVTGGPVEHANTTNSKEEIQSANREDPGRPASVEDNATERGPENEVSSAPIDDPRSSSLLGKKVDTEMKQMSFFMVRVPRFSDDKLKMQIQHAQQEVDEKTRSRDSIRVAMQKQKAVCTEYWRKVEDARKEERAARDAVASKRQEIDSIQSILGKIKNATSISDIDNRIQNLQHRINHETNTLKEEKLLIREMNQLKQSREHLSSSSASEKELQEAFEKQEQMETRLQHLKEEVDTLRKDVLRAEGNTKEAKTRYDDQCQYLRDLQTQFKASDDLRQEAYTNLRNLKKESYLKNEYFYSYKDDMKAATSYTFSGDREALRSHCANQVEKMMEMWNKSDEFRNQYVKANMPSTLRRFRTLDGRSLGPDEEPAIIHGATEQKENVIFPPLPKNNSPAPVSERKQEKADASPSAAKMYLADEPTVTQKSQSQKPKRSAKSTVREATPSREDDKEEEEKETKRTIEEEELAKKAEELARKEEELRKEEEAAELREQLRLEQIAKAKEAEERKQRKAEKAQVRAEIKAQKEAELREKKREKKERKKERKVTATNTDDACEADVAATPVGIPREDVQEQPEKLVAVVGTASKRPSRSWAATKDYNKVKPLPPPLRNRGKRKMMQTWMWVLLTALLVLALFIAGNFISFSRFGLQNLSFSSNTH